MSGVNVSEAVEGLGAAGRPEHAFLLRCIRAHFGTAEPPSPALLDGVDEAVLMAEAAEHGLIPLVHRVLDRVAGGPEGLRRAFRAEAQRIVASNLVLARELAALAERFAAEGLPVLAFKGPAQALQAYGDLGFRPFSDLDVLVRWADLERTLDVLAARGYHVPEHTRSDDRLRAYGYHVPCYHPATGVLVEVHWHPVSHRFPLRLDADGYGERAEVLDLGGGRVPALGREDTLLVTCAHATKHHWERLEWAVSVAALAVSPPDAPASLDWGRVLRLAERGGIRRVVLTGLALAEHLSGVPLPAEIGTLVASDRRARTLARRVLRTTLGRWRAAPPSATEPLREVRFHLLVRDDVSDGLRFLLTPKETDRAEVAADDAPLPVVAGARLVRLVRRHLVIQGATVAERLRRWRNRG